MEMFKKARAISAVMAIGKILKRSKTSYKRGTSDGPLYKQLLSQTLFFNFAEPS